jgi:hypothetical protein
MCLVYILVAIALIVITAVCLHKSQTAENYPMYKQIGPRYIETCGQCLQSLENPEIWQQQCVVYSPEKYFLDQYTMTKTCQNCTSGQYGQNCAAYVHPGGQYAGQLLYPQY